jgi:hypothetical protein
MTPVGENSAITSLFGERTGRKLVRCLLLGPSSVLPASFKTTAEFRRSWCEAAISLAGNALATKENARS